MEAFAAISMIQGGQGFPKFASAVLDYFSSRTLIGVQVQLDNLPLQLKALFQEVY